MCPQPLPQLQQLSWLDEVRAVKGQKTDVKCLDTIRFERDKLGRCKLAPPLNSTGSRLLLLLLLPSYPSLMRPSTCLRLHFTLASDWFPNMGLASFKKLQPVWSKGETSPLRKPLFIRWLEGFHYVTTKHILSPHASPLRFHFCVDISIVPVMKSIKAVDSQSLLSSLYT